MNRFLVVFAISLCVRDIIEVFDGDASIAAADQAYDQLLKFKDTCFGPAVDATNNHSSTTSDDVNCTIDDVTAARRSLCPAHCCSPLDGQDVWTKLTVDCANNYPGTVVIVIEVRVPKTHFVIMLQ